MKWSAELQIIWLQGAVLKRITHLTNPHNTRVRSTTCGAREFFFLTGMFAASLLSALGGRNILKSIGTLVLLLSWTNCFTSPPNMREVPRIEVIRSDCRCSDRPPCCACVTNKLKWWWISAIGNVECTNVQMPYNASNNAESQSLVNNTCGACTKSRFLCRVNFAKTQY